MNPGWCRTVLALRSERRKIESHGRGFRDAQDQSNERINSSQFERRLKDERSQGLLAGKRTRRNHNGIQRRRHPCCRQRAGNLLIRRVGRQTEKPRIESVSTPSTASEFEPDMPGLHASWRFAADAQRRSHGRFWTPGSGFCNARRISLRVLQPRMAGLNQASIAQTGSAQATAPIGQRPKLAAVPLGHLHISFRVAHPARHCEAMSKPDGTRHYFLRCRILARLRRFVLPILRRPLPVLFVPISGNSSVI